MIEINPKEILAVCWIVSGIIAGLNAVFSWKKDKIIVGDILLFSAYGAILGYIAVMMTIVYMFQSPIERVLNIVVIDRSKKE